MLQDCKTTRTARLQGLQAYFPAVPIVNLTGTLPLFYAMKGLGYVQDNLYLQVRFLLIGLAYLFPLDVFKSSSVYLGEVFKHQGQSRP